MEDKEHPHIIFTVIISAIAHALKDLIAKRQNHPWLFPLSCSIRRLKFFTLITRVTRNFFDYPNPGVAVDLAIELVGVICYISCLK